MTTITIEQARECYKDWMVENAFIKESESLPPDNATLNDIGLDSLDIVDLQCDIENDLNISISDLKKNDCFLDIITKINEGDYDQPQ